MSDIAEIRRRLAEETQEVPCASCLGTRKGEGECCEDCDGLGTDEVPLIKGLQHYLDCIEVVENDPVVGAAQYYLYAYTAAFTVACMEWLISRTYGRSGSAVKLYPPPRSSSGTDWGVVISQGWMYGNTLHEAVVRATWAVAQDAIARRTT